MTTMYRLFGTGLPWEGKEITREAALGLLHSFCRCPQIYVQSCTYRRRTTRVWVLTPRSETIFSCFNLVAEHSREASL